LCIYAEGIHQQFPFNVVCAKILLLIAANIADKGAFTYRGKQKELQNIIILYKFSG
jgi:hypothetical protein